MTKNASVTDDSSSLSSILLKREAATSTVIPEGTIPVNRPPSASSTGSFQLISSSDDVLTTATRRSISKDKKGESISGGGVLQVRIVKIHSCLFLSIQKLFPR